MMGDIVGHVSAEHPEALLKANVNGVTRLLERWVGHRGFHPKAHVNVVLELDSGACESASANTKMETASLLATFHRLT